MAKKEKIDLDRMDSFDLEDDWGMDPIPSQTRDGKGDRNPVKKAGATVLREMGKTAFTKQMAGAILKEALPRSFTTTLNNVDKGLTSTRAFYADVRKDAQPMVRELKALGRTLGRFAPTKYQQKIDSLLRSNTDSSGRQLAQINLEDVAVLQQMGAVFGQDQKNPVGTGIEEITEKLTDQEYKFKIGSSIASIQNLLSRQVSYQMGVQRAFQKKSMELQIRQLMISRSQLDVTTKAAVETSNLLRSIVENTGLPDVVKQHRSEEFMRMARERVFGRAQQEMYNWTSQYRSQLKSRAQQVLKEKFDRFSAGFRMANDGIEQLEQQKELLASMGITPEEFLAQMGGNFGAIQVGKRIGKFINKRAPSLRRTDGLFQGINYVFNNKERLASDWGSSGYSYGKWHDGLTNTIKDILRNNYKDSGIVRSGGLSDGGKKEISIEDRKLSYMEEQTGYLSRILHSIDILRTGNNNIERTVYNRQKGVFTSFSESQATAREALLKDKDIEGQRDNVLRLLTSIDPTNRLVGPAKESIVKYLMARVRTSKAFNPAAMANEKIAGLSRDDQRLWQGLLAKRYGLKLNEKSEWNVNPFSSSNVNLNVDAGQYNYTSGQTQGLFNKAHALVQSGNIEELIAEGAVVFNNGNWELNKDYYESRVNGTKIGTPPPTPAANGRFPRRTGPGFGGNQDTGNLNRFGSNWNNPSSVNFNMNRPNEKDAFKEALEKQTDALVERMSKSQAFFETILPEIHHDVSEIPPALQRLLESDFGTGDGGGTGGGGGSGGRRRRKWYNRSIKGAFRAGLRGAQTAGSAIWRAGGVPFKMAKGVYDKVKRPALSALTTISTFGLNKVFSLGRQAFEMAQDGYIRTATGVKKVIEKEGLSAGRYVDMATGKVIHKLSDIRGAVWDVVAGTQVMTDDEARDGLFSSDGKRIKTHLSRAIGAVKSILGGKLSPYGLLRSAVKGVSGVAGYFLNTLPDIYVVGETKPRLYSAKLARGEYYSMRTGKRIKTLKDIDGDVGTLDPMTRTMTPVMTAEDAAKGLVDRNGRQIRTGLMRLLNWGGSALRGIGRFAMAPLRLLSAGGQLISKAVTGGLRTAGRFVGRGFGLNVGGGKGSDTLWTKRIYKLLVNQFTGRNPLEGVEDDDNGHTFFSRLRRGKNRIAGNAKDAINRLKDRTGSWWNRLYNGKEKAPKPEHVEREAKKSGGWGKLLWSAVAGIGGLVGKLVSGFSGFWGWIKNLPKWIAAAKAGSAAEDLLGDVAGGRRRGGLLRKTGRLLKAGGKGLLAAGGFLGRGLLSGGGLLVRGAVAAAGMLGSVASAPVLLTAAAVAGAGYLIYKGWQAYKGRMTNLRNYRVAQYGFDPKDDNKAGKVLALEEAVLKQSQIGGDGKLKIGSLPYQDLIAAFDIDISDERNVLRWMRWYRMRFTPVFTKNVETLNKMDSKAKITDSDFLKDSQKPDFARATFIASSNQQSPYLVSDAPFANFSAVTGDKFVAGYRDEIIRKYQKEEKAAIASGEKKVVPLGADKPQNPTVQAINAKVVQQQRDVNPVTDLYYSPGDKLKAGVSITGDSRRDELIQIGNRIDDLTAIRMKLYGLAELVKDDVNTIIPLEADTLKYVKYVDKGVATFTGDANDFFTRWNGSFSVNANNAKEREQWVVWFKQRFLPVFLNFCSESNFIAPGMNPTTAWRRLNASDLLKIANFMNQASTLMNNQRISVWSVKAFPWPKRTANTDSSVIQSNLDALRTESKKEVYQEKIRTEKEIKEMTFDGKSLRSTTTGNKIADLLSDVNGMNAVTKGRATGPNGVGVYGQRYASSGTSYERAGTGYEYSDTDIVHSGEGTGGSINDLPVPQADGWGPTKDLIVAASKMTGMDAGTLAAMIAQESDFRSKVGSNSSSAKGLGQFIDDTWKEILPTLVKKYGVNPNTPPTDPRASVLATAEYMKQNARQIGDIGRPWTTTDYYMAHFLGAGDAKKVLTASADTDLATALGDRYRKVANANPGIFKGLRTTGDLYRHLSGLMANKGGKYSEEARALANQNGIPAPEGVNTTSDSGTATTPPLPKSVAKPTTDTTPSTAALPMGDTTKVSMYNNRSTDNNNIAVSRTSDTRDEVATGQQAAQRDNQVAAGRQAIAERRAQNAAQAESTTSWTETLNDQLAVQKEMRDRLGDIVDLIKGGIGKSGADTNAKASPNAQRLKTGDSVTSNLKQSGNSLTPFNPAINTDFSY